MRKIKDYYAILHVGYTASRDEIRHAYLNLKGRYRDDADKLADIQEAWGTLGDSSLRAKYDKYPAIKSRRRISQRNESKSVGSISKTQIIPAGIPDATKTLIMERPQGIQPNGDDNSKTVIRRVRFPTLYLKIKDANGAVQERSFTQERITIGRFRTQDIVLEDDARYVSRQHAHIELRGSDFYVVDTSSNGTQLNGRKLNTEEPHRLADGDFIDIEGWRLTVHFDRGREK